MALTNKLTAIANAIRSKTGKTEAMTLDQMPTEIESISGGSGDLTDEDLTFSGDCGMLFSTAKAWVTRKFGSRIKTINLIASYQMFYGYIDETIPFELNFDPNVSHELLCTFQNANIKSFPKIDNLRVKSMESTFRLCRNIKNFDNIKFLTPSYPQVTMNYTFKDCYNLEKMPDLSFVEGTSSTNSTNCVFGGIFDGCYSLKKIENLPLQYSNTMVNNNLFSSITTNVVSLEKYTLSSNRIVQWTNQTINLSSGIGYCSQSYYYPQKSAENLTDENEVTDDDSYQRLKNEDWWWTYLPEYSHYNHDSAVETINSLPDTSAYLASNGGTNTIKFKGASGAKTDGGAISTMTEEEIAVATAKGWTVTFV